MALFNQPPPRQTEGFSNPWKDWLYYLWEYVNTVNAPIVAGDFLKVVNNLDDLNDASIARTNLGLVSGGTGDIWLEIAANLSDIGDVQTALNNIDINGTQNYLPKFNSTDGLGDSALADDGTQIDATDRSFLLTGTTGAVPTEIETAGTHLAWIPSLAAIRAGRVNSTQWATANIGSRSAAFGNNNTASGTNSFCTGGGNVVSGNNSAGFGQSNTNAGSWSFVSGFGNTLDASTNYCSIFGASNDILAGFYNTILGGSNTITGTANYSTTIGINNEADNQYNVLLGNSNLATADNVITIGNGNDCSGASNIAIGTANTCTGARGVMVGQYLSVSHDDSQIFGSGYTEFFPLSSYGANTVSIGSNSDLPALVITGGGGSGGISDVLLPNDDEKLYLGDLQDASFTYSAAGNLEANPKEVGTGYFNILGDLVVDENLTVGSGATGIDYTLTFNGETNDGLITWMEDEDYFNVADVILASDKIAFTQTDLNEYIDSLNDGYIDYKATTGHRFGTDSDSTNYTNIANDGTITLNGNARVTKHLSIQNFDLGKGTTTPTQVILGNYTGWEYTIGDDSVVSIDLPHDADYSADFNIYIRWYINEAYATNNGEIQWQVDWSAATTDETEAVDSPGSSGTLTSGDINIPATAKYLTETSALTIGAANIADNGDLLGLTISRIAITDGADPTANPVIVSVHIEYTSNKLGT